MSTEKIRLTGAVVAAARRLLKITQADLAKAAGVTKVTINNFENGHRTPHERTLNTIRDVLESQGIEFYNGDSPGVRLRPKVNPT